MPAADTPARLPGLTSRRVKRNRRFWGVGLALVVLALVLVILLNRGSGNPTAAGQSRGGAGHPHKGPPPHAVNPRLDPDWEGDGQAGAFAFGGDVHFPTGTTWGIAWRPTRAALWGRRCPPLLSGVDLSMVNFESALTNGTCPQPQPKSYVFSAPASRSRAFEAPM